MKWNTGKSSAQPTDSWKKISAKLPNIGCGPTGGGSTNAMMSNNPKTILVCPLDWGLGHATRCIPLIKKFLNEGNRVILGADKNPLSLLKQEFPELETIVVPGYEVEYSESGSWIQLLIESLRFRNFIKEEKKLIDQIIREHPIDLIVSDNRYGFYSNQVQSILITHQIFVKAPVAEPLIHKQIGKLLDKFNEVWIPDYEGDNNLSGDLSHLKSIRQKHRFIGPLSRFEKPRELPESIYDLCAVLSGPEPQRTILEEKVREQIRKHGLNAAVVRGLPNAEPTGEAGIFNHLPADKLQDLMLKSKRVLCRSGYSSIMDLVTLGKSAILIPTPGQTEQEYLAEFHKNSDQFDVQLQDELELDWKLF
ncbi:MAG: glycosyltransferase [Flavobacteriales bacterium]|nr:glycosyltransferase [Flavobacteriales bacterium]